MNRLFGTIFLAAVFATNMVKATDATWYNIAILTFPPQVDATNVINNGSLIFLTNTTALPFDTSNTRNFTNNGTMIGSAGFQFDNRPSVGTRKLAANFQNRNAGIIEGVDQARGYTTLNGVPLIEEDLIPSYVLVSATNIINEGTLSVGAAGLMRLTGTNVNLARGGLAVNPILPIGSGVIGINYFYPDIAIYDKYWGGTNQTGTDTRSMIQVGADLIVTSPFSAVNFHPEPPPIISISGFARIQLINPFGSFYTNTFGTTNISFTNSTGFPGITNVPVTSIVQAVFVGLPDSPNMETEIRFSSSTINQNPFKTASVRFSLTSTNVVSASPELTSIYIVDTLASEINAPYYTNFNNPIFDKRPGNYEVSRLSPIEYLIGFGGNAPFSGDLLYKTNYAISSVTNNYSAYSCFADNIASRPPNIPAGTVTNLPGKLEIFADSLDVNKTRLRAEGLLNIRTRHLVNSSNAVVDCENLAYNLGSTNGNLKIQSLAQETVVRLKGTNSMWSGLWTNRQEILIENYSPNPADTNTFILSPITNIVEVRIHVLMVDASDMLVDVPVVVNELTTRSTNVVQNDTMTVVQSFNTDAQSYTLNGGLTFSNTFFTDTSGNVVLVSLDSWVATNAPNLKYFTNNGTMRIPNESHFGDDRVVPYSAFVNKGTINSFGMFIDSDYCELGGSVVTEAELMVETQSGKVENGQATCQGDIVFYAGVLKFNRSTFETRTRFDMTVTNSLFDSGSTSSNTIRCGDGFRLLSKPLTGDLLGTTFESIPPPFASVSHVWAGNNLGVSKSGYSNNVAIGRLVLKPGGFDPFFVFSGTGANNGMYVDFLDLSLLSDYENQIALDPNLTIYYAAAQLSFVPPGGMTPEEYLDQQFGGRLRWVSQYAGANSSVDVLINGNQTIKVNKALRSSTLIDSDSDGIPNFYDITPFGGVMIQSIAKNSSPAGYRLTWAATAGMVYRVEYKTNAVSAPWTLLLNATNTASVTTNISVMDTNVTSGGLQRYYRVTYNPNGP